MVLLRSSLLSWYSGQALLSPFSAHPKVIPLSRFQRLTINNESNILKNLFVTKNKAITLSVSLTIAMMCLPRPASAARAPVPLGAAGNFAILAKSGISSVPTSAVTGDIGVSPIDATAITGFSLTHGAASPFATSAQITGKAYAPDYSAPTPVNLTAAIGDMQTAYTDAAGRTTPDFTELGAGEIGGLTLVPGLYKWGTDVLISTDVTLNGSATDVWIFQIAGKLIQANGKRIILTGGALPQNIFWQCFGTVTIGTTAHFEGIILSKTSTTLGNGASVNGRLLAQTAVTLTANDITAPPSVIGPVLTSAAVVTGPYTDAAGQSLNLGTKTITVPRSGAMQFYRVRSNTALTIAKIAVSGGNIVVTYN
jgi:hypothetical protein